MLSLNFIVPHPLLLLFLGGDEIDFDVVDGKIEIKIFRKKEEQFYP